MLDRPDLLAEIRRMIGDRPALMEPWNVMAIDGRFGLTAIARTTDEAERMVSATRDVVSQAAARAAQRSSAPRAGGT